VTCVSALCALSKRPPTWHWPRRRGSRRWRRSAHALHVPGPRRAGALSQSGRLRPPHVEHDGILIGEAGAFPPPAPALSCRAQRAPSW
jgi:hypothetical protein